MKVRNMYLYVPMLAVSANAPLMNQVRGYLRGQWILINGMKARLVNVTEKNVVLWMKQDNMMAVWH